MASDGLTVIVAGTELDLSNIVDGDPTDVPWLLVSADAGATWDESLGWTGEEPGCLDSLAVRDGVAVIGAQCPPPEAATRFAATLAKDDPS